MLKHIVCACLIFLIICISCKNALGPDNARHIAGTYSITMNSNQSNTYGDYLVVTKINKNNVKVVINYANSSSTDIVLDKMSITKNGSVYDVDQLFSNFSSSGNINGNTFTLNLNYVNGSYLQVIAVK
jgi:hypothetical protein